MLLWPTKILHRIPSLLLLNVTVSIKTAQIPLQGVLPFLWQVSSNRANRGHFYNRCHHSHHQRLWCLHPPQSGQRLLTQRPQCQLHEGKLSACAGGGCLLLFTITPGTLCPILLLISWPDVNLPRMIHHILKKHLTTAGYETECLIWKHLKGYWHTCVIFQLEFRFINIFKYAAHFCVVYAVFGLLGTCLMCDAITVSCMLWLFMIWFLCPSLLPG